MTKLESWQLSINSEYYNQRDFLYMVRRMPILFKFPWFQYGPLYF